jgi:LPS export ABC transporter protein LptC
MTNIHNVLRMAALRPARGKAARLSGELWQASRRPAPSLVMLLVLVAALSACREEFAAPVGAPALLETGADAVFVGLEHYIGLDGVREGKLYADTAYAYSDSSLWVLTNPILVIYTETGLQRARVTSERGRMKTASREMTAQGNVILQITEGNRRVESEELNYDPNGDRIWSDSLSTLYEAGVTSRGMGFTSDLEFRNLRVGAGSIIQRGGGPRE